MNEISSDMFELFAYRVEMHGIVSAAEIATVRYGSEIALALLDKWYALGDSDRVVQSDTNIAAMADARTAARANPRRVR
jgi:hypothetical protein